MPEFLLRANTKRRGQSGSPCRILRLTAKPLSIITPSYFNPKYGPIEKRWSKIERFFKVHRNTDAWNVLVYSNMSSIVLAASKIDVLFTYAFWLHWIYSNNRLKLVPIVWLMFYRCYFGVHIDQGNWTPAFFINLLSLPLFSNKAITACFWELESLPWSCAQF